MNIAPWPDFAGKIIHEGDTIEHLSGECGVVVFLANETDPGDQWRVDYGTGDLSRLCLQIGDKGRAVVRPKTKKCLLIGGPANGKVIHKNDSLSVMMEENKKTFRYDPVYYRWNDRTFEVFIHGDRPEDRVVMSMIREADLLPVSRLAPLNPDQ